MFSPANRNKQEGMALLLALMAVIMIAGAVVVVMISTRNSSQFTERANNDAALDEACKAAVDIGIERVWHQYVVGNGNTTGNLASYKLFINNIVPNNEVLNGVQRDYNGDGTITLNSPVDLYTATNARALASGATITGLQLARCDDTASVMLTLTATVQITSGTSPQTKTATQTVKISGTPFAGFQFAVLANNINCILCHADFKNMDMYKLNSSTGAIVMKSNAECAYGTTDRIKVASLESVLIRTDEADSRTAGSWYTRGNVYNKSGTLLTASGIASAFSSGGFGAYTFSSTNGKITQNSSTGAMSTVALTNAATTNGCPAQFANLYLSYPSDTAKMTDGPLPQSFPPPFPDDNGNRLVDTAEFTTTMNTATGSITGGIAVGVASGSTYSGTTLPTATDTTTMTQLASGKYDGNLILVGTASNPIVIDQEVAVNGDVVIKGVIKGYGALQVKGNVYVVGDVTYADAAGTFGKAADGTENAFALEAGGNMLMGDYTTIRAKNNYVATKSGTKYIDSVDTGVWQGQFVQVDETAGTATMSSGKTTAVGYMDSSVIDPGIVPTGAGTVTSTYTYTASSKTHTVQVQPESQTSFTSSELMLFNRMEHKKWAPPGNADYDANYYVEDYTPRYYKLRDSAGVYEYLVTSSTDSNLVEHVVNYASPGVTALTTTSTDKYYMGTNAAVLSLAPKNSWISESTLRQIWYDDETARRASPSVVNGSIKYSPFRFDGLLYTNNSIFGVIRSNGRHGSMMYGKLWVRGGIVCADLGLLSTDNAHTSSSDSYYGGIQVYYDKRVTAFLNIVDPTQVAFERSVYQR